MMGSTTSASRQECSTTATTAEGTITGAAMEERPPVLVAYASRFGSTRGVAERIAATLRQAGQRVALQRCDEVVDLTPYAAVVFGSPVFNGRWMPEAEQFVQRNAKSLAVRPVWLFSVGTFGDSRRIIGRLMTREPRDIGDIRQALHPREYRVFAGVIDRHQWPAASRLLFHSLGGRLGDNRDWRAIEAWADKIHHALELRTNP
jgi:menaquinone-dependent protoporphyrinogen oxidase